MLLPIRIRLISRASSTPSASSASRQGTGNTLEFLGLPRTCLAKRSHGRIGALAHGSPMGTSTKMCSAPENANTNSLTVAISRHASTLPRRVTANQPALHPSTPTRCITSFQVSQYVLTEMAQSKTCKRSYVSSVRSATESAGVSSTDPLIWLSAPRYAEFGWRDVVRIGPVMTEEDMTTHPHSPLPAMSSIRGRLMSVQPTQIASKSLSLSNTKFFSSGSRSFTTWS